MRGSKSIVAALYERRNAAVVHSRYQSYLSFLPGPGRSGAAVTLGEFFHTAGRIHEFLFAGEKRMTSSADTDSNVAPGRAGLIYRSTRAHHVGLVIFWVNVCFHVRNERRM
jgi:hypothetical protein